MPGTALGTFSIVPLIADAVKNIPLMAAGGITDNRTARAAHALGAEGVFAGSVFIGTEESRVPLSIKNRIIAANGLDLLLFRTQPHYYRSLPGKLAETLVAMDKAGASHEELGRAMGDCVACVLACWRGMLMKAISHSVRGSALSAASKAPPVL